MSEIVSINSNNPLVGVWRPSDDFSDLEISIGIGTDEGIFHVLARDLSDGETAEVTNVFFEDDVLRFTLYWPSSGRTVSYKFMIQSDTTVASTFTFTAQEIWLKKET